MKYLLLITSITCLMLTDSVNSASLSFDDNLGDISILIARCVANEEYPLGLTTVDSLLKLHPAEPLIHLLKATILFGRMKSYYDDLDNNTLEERCNEIEKMSLKLINAGNTQADIRFCLGTVWFYRSQMALIEGRKLDMIRSGMKSGRYFEESMRLDSTYWDTYLGLGSYYFYRTQGVGLIKYLPIFEDKRQLGWQLVEKGAEKGTVTRLTAQLGLAWMSLAECDYRDAIERAEPLLREFPRSRSLMRCLGRAQMNLGLAEETKSTFGKLLASIRRETRNNHYYELECLHSMAKASRILERWEEVQQLCREALSLQLDKDVRRRRAKELKSFKQMLKEAEKEING